MTSETTPTIETAPKRTLLTVRQFVERHPWATEGGMRALIFRAEENGLDKCIRRIGRRVLLDQALVFEWIDGKDGSGSHA